MRDLLLDAWRAATAADDDRTFVTAMASGLSRHMPLGRLALWRLDPELRSLMSRAEAGVAGHVGSVLPAAVPLTDAEARRLQTWLKHQTLTVCRHGERPDSAIAAAVRPFGSPRPADLMLLPLRATNHLAEGYFLTVESLAPARVSGEERRLIASLADPFAAALAHQGRVAELRALRDAAEADRQALLRRYGRERLTDEIIGANRGLKPVLDRVAIVARADLPVLIFGETGSGKEVIARAVHDGSPRQHRPFIRVNCGAIPPDLIDSELFGHERGAFTGATDQRRGWFEQADSGTLFLDEVGDLPLPAQVRLLRVLQDGTMQRVGGQRSLQVDVRIVAATHRDLPALVERREFREDLWYRIAAFPILLPPLREHRQDIPELAGHFVRRAARRFGLHAAPLTAEDLALLDSYAWPGNVRELASVIDRAVIVGGGATLAIDTALGVTTARQAPAARERGAGEQAVQRSTGAEPLDQVVRQHIELVLRQTRGVIEGRHGAAVILGVNPHTLRARMRKLGVQWAAFRGWPGASPTAR